MKKIIPALFTFLFSHHILAQSVNTDSLKKDLANTTKLIERFDLLNKMIEATIINLNYVDSSAIMQLHRIAQQLNNDSLLAISYNVIGSYFLVSKDDDITALEYLFKAIPLAEQTKDRRRISSIYFDIALVNVKLQNLENVLKYTLKGGENMPDKSSSAYYFMEAQYEGNMAGYYLLKHEPDSALHYAQRLAETSRRSKDHFSNYYAQYLNGGAYGLLGDKEMADIHFRKGRALGDSVRGLPKLISAQIYIPYLLNNKRYNEARVQAIQLLHLGQQTNYNNMKLFASGFLRMVFEKLGSTDSAYYYSQMESSIKDSIFNQNNINKIQSLTFNEQLRIIETEAKQAAAEMQRKKNLQYILLGLGSITFIIIFLLLSRSFITNTKLIRFLGVVALLIVFEFLNLLLHPFLEKITNHSPALMLLSLVSIASLLVPLHHRLEKWATNKLVEKNKQIRLAAAKKTIEELESREQV